MCATNEAKIKAIMAEAKESLKREYEANVLRCMNITSVEDFAEHMHNTTCGLNHTDRCGWYYEVGSENEWERAEHKYWLNRAKEELSLV